jgi:hypothetical protein
LTAEWLGITGVSDAPIPWPIAQTLPSGRARSLVLYGDHADPPG